jgi:hypothetical protein
MRTMEFTMSRPGLVEPGQEVETAKQLLLHDRTCGCNVGKLLDTGAFKIQKRHCKRSRRNQPWILRTGGI